MENTYGKTNNVFFAVVPENRDATSAVALEAIAWLTERSWQIPYATRVDSLTNFQHSTADGDDILVRDLLEVAAAGEGGERSGDSRDRPGRAAACGAPDRARRRVGGVNVTVALPGGDEMREGSRVAAFAYGLADRVASASPAPTCA